MEQYERKLKCELYNDHMQNFKSYGIPKAQLIIGDMPYCYDEETECWTALGWKKYTELNYDDTVLSLNPATMEIEYSGIENIIVRDNTERMVRFETMHMNLLVTENHRMFVRHRYKSHSAGIRKRKFTSTDGIRLAKDVNGGWYIPRSGYTWKSASEQREIIIPSCELNTNGRESIADELHIPLDKWLPFFGLWLADGCTCNSKARNGRQLYTVSIKQAGEKRKIVREMLKDFPLKSIEYAEKNNDKSNFNIFSKQLWIYLHQFGKSKEKFVPRWILDLPTDYLRLLWKWYTFGDSHRNGDGLTISSVSEQLMLDMQEVALKLGTICQMRTENYEYHSSPMWCFHFNPNSKDITYGSKQYVDGYKGKVWCITCKTNSVFLVRRRGLIAWCGNCVGDDAYGSSPSWYLQGDNKCGESELAHSSFFDTDDYFRIPEFMDFCTRMLRPDPKMGGGETRQTGRRTLHDLVLCV